MKAHFIGDLTGNIEDYKEIISALESLGWEVVTKHSITRNLKEVEAESPEESELYAKKMSTWIKKADAVVVEVTVPGLGAGYEVATAMDLGKPVIALYKPNGNNTPYVLKGMEKSEKMQVLSWSDSTLKEVLDVGLEYAMESMDTRFNFFISPKHQNYLDWISKERKIPRAVFLRNLIEREMENDEEFSG
jgi:nucleoside 2-deoxyribosyltransferase